MYGKNLPICESAGFLLQKAGESITQKQMFLAERHGNLYEITIKIQLL